jgi:hypothetical protein
MIGNIKIGKSFRGVLNYCLEDKLEYSEEQKLDMERKDGLTHLNRAEILEFNMCYGSRRELIEQFTDVRNLRPQLSKPVMHISLSFDPKDKTDEAKLRMISQDFAQKFGFDKHQYISILHKDTRHKHLHIIANRVGFAGERVSDSQNYKKVSAICRELELKYDLKPVLSPRLFLGEKDKHLPRQDQRQESLTQLIRENLLEAENYSDFKTRMENQHVRVIKGRGIAFQDDKKVYFKGSQLGYSLANMEKILEYPLQQRRDLNQRIALTHLQEVKRENWSDEQKQHNQVKEFLRNSSRWEFNHPNEERQVSITKDLKAQRVLNELCIPEFQKQMIGKLLQEMGPKNRQRHSLRHI